MSMSIKSSSKTLLTISLSLLVAFLPITPGRAQSPLTQAAPPDILPGEIVVKFQANVDRLGAQSSLRAEGLRPLEVAPGSEAIRVAVEPGQEAQAIAELLARGDVAYATYNYEIKALGDPNDPLYGNQWPLKHPQDHDIDAPEGWDIYTGSNNTTLAIIDTGVDLDHPDLAAKIVTGKTFHASYPVGTLPDDDSFIGHGTHVAGIAAAIGNNGIGIAGVSWGARIMPLKILNSSGNGGTYELSQAIRYAADNGARVINMSLGGSCGSGWPDVAGAVSYALGKGVMLIAAAGNSGSSPVMCPAAMSGVLAVGATNYNDEIAYYSNYGSALDVAAPGDQVYSTLPGGTYGHESGTSMASPHVAGLAALLFSYMPSLSNTQVSNIIEETADDFGAAGWDQFYGYGRINVGRALARIGLQTIPSQPLLLIDDDIPFVVSNIQVVTNNPETITWSAAISPTVPWLSLDSPAAGAVSGSSSNQFIALRATTTSLSHYDSYTATLVLSGTTASGKPVSPNFIQVRLQYLAKVNTYYFPIFFKK
jgi:thermitase